MRECRKCVQILNLMVDGAASTRDERLARLHLDRCPACQAAVAQLRDIDRALADDTPPQVPACLHDAILRELDRRAEGRTLQRRRMPLALELTTFAGVLLGLGGLSYVTGCWVGASLSVSAATVGVWVFLVAGIGVSLAWDDGI